jgi:hypothetical protein
MLIAAVGMYYRADHVALLRHEHRRKRKRKRKRKEILRAWARRTNAAVLDLPFVKPPDRRRPRHRDRRERRYGPSSRVASRTAPNTRRFITCTFDIVSLRATRRSTSSRHHDQLDQLDDARPVR